MKRFWPELAVLALGLIFAAVSLGGDCPCVNCQCGADCPCVAMTVSTDDGHWQQVCDGKTCRTVWVSHKPAAKKMPVGPVPAVAVPVQQTAEPPLAAGPVRAFLSQQPLRSLAHRLFHRLRHPFGGRFSSCGE